MDQNVLLSSEKPDFSMTSNTLKYIAILAMVIDHTAVMFFLPGYQTYAIMRTIGRITGPTMFYFAVEGYHHTRNFERYLLRLLTFAIASYLPFIYFTYGGLPKEATWFHFNVMFTIAFSLMAVHARRKITQWYLKIPVIVLLMFLVLPADWGITGFMMIFVFDYFYGDFKQQRFGYLLLLLFDIGLISILLVPFSSLWYEHKLNLDYPFSFPNIINLGHLLPIFLLRFYKGKQGQRTFFSKWFFYIFYPLHMIILRVIKGII